MASVGAVEPCEPWPLRALSPPASASRTCSAQLTSQAVAAPKIRGLTLVNPRPTAGSRGSSR
jgi:hypothetical protein